MTLQLPPSLAGHELVVVDVEGNGQQPPEIIEIAVLPLSASRPTTIEDLRTWLIRPTRPITALVTRKVHGITDADVADAPSWAEVADEISAAIAGQVVVAHHASVERRVLGAHLPDWDPPLVLDTLRLAKAIWHDLPGGHSLDNLITTAHLTPPPTPSRPGTNDAGTGRSGTTTERGLWRHRAGYDAWMTAALLGALVKDACFDWDLLTAVAQLPQPEPSASEDGLW